MAPLAPYLGAIEIVLAVVITVLVVIQSKGSDLSSLTGGGGSSERFGTRRGAEALLHRITIGISIVFFVITVLTFVAMGQ